MSHAHHGGGGGVGSRQDINKSLAESYWYLIAGATGFAALVRVANHLESRRRLRRLHAESVAHPTKPTNWLTQAWATATAVVREASNPRLFMPVRFLRWASPPSLGRVIVLLAYWAVIIYMMAGHGAIIDGYSHWEQLAFRNAWTTIMQMPFLYLLAMKVNPIGLLTGISHERLNWLHRWVGRTMLVTATVHGFYFWTIWVRGDFVEWQMRILPRTKEGLGAWAVLLWTFLTTFRPLRHLAYEVFVAQHVLSYIFLIYLVYVHIGGVGVQYVWFTIATVCFDRAARWGLLAYQNLRLKPDRSNCKGMRRVGHQAQLRAVGTSTTVVTIKDVHFSWRPGQHLYLWMPRLGPLEAHPYTVACAHQLPETCICNSVQLVVRKHGGFSKRLHDRARKMEDEGRGSDCLTAFVIGPFGAPPRWDIYETLILISASTGASFTLPILEAVVQSKQNTCVKRVDFILLACQGEEIDFYLQRLRGAITKARVVDLELTVHIAVTRSDIDSQMFSDMLHDGNLGQSQEGRTSSPDSASTSTLQKRRPASASKCCQSSACVHGQSEADAITPAAASSPMPDLEKGLRDDLSAKSSKEAYLEKETKATGPIREYTSRPDIEALIRGPVEETGGETSVVVCGGPSLTSSVRNSVTSLADERAVHKGTGAQGIHLFVEEYCF
ncbi:ferric reductase like transmembrane component-domain-containing protein [Plectosphaerella cucumerina]|uniref:ferric-chelate reductase (NADPH) n=1 Tax=Plectosphaerella cucumerina TaxID=40658 RepID=A0A8K0X8D5_9PEZI|nr:ferric reductase like transmembrane component-domain-containing protein [Plectosphaerella cucumerina]